MTSPIQEIRDAAQKLRTLVTDLGDCRGPWYIVNREQHPYPQRIDNIGVPYIVASTTTDPSHPPTMADYICAMHPGVGGALPLLLEGVASQAVENDHEECAPYCTPEICDVAAALAVARQILGSQP
ncbi:hypothetical protein MUK60_07590 [Streptomyces sp. LRE541]|uniref:hypothetical protein n=1 Tax=Streptomyces sp. LRE541 TaxID=2931983 RepID=UPI00201038E9|nr:hypothetical protein [Streptomyces sp. LRE541]UPZ27696.1 hypothetical protein MUK60_07590 [Streptomyces sp. LRE541]